MAIKTLNVNEDILNANDALAENLKEPIQPITCFRDESHVLTRRG